MIPFAQVVNSTDNNSLTINVSTSLRQITSPFLNSRFDPPTKNQITFVNTSSSSMGLISMNETTGLLSIEESFGFTNMTDGVEFRDFGIYRDITESSLFFRDLVLKRPFSPPQIFFGLQSRVSYRVNKLNEKVYELLICTKNNLYPAADNCTIFAIDTNRTPTNTSQIRFRQKSQFNPIYSVCA